MNFYISIFLLFFLSLQSVGQPPAASKSTKQFSKKNHSFFGKKHTGEGEKTSSKHSKRKEKRQSNTNADAFSVNGTSKNYGVKAKGSRVKFGRRKTNSEGFVSDGGFTASNAYSMDYGDKSFGKKVKKKINRKIKKNSLVGDAFASSANVRKGNSSNMARGKSSKNKNKLHLFRFIHFQSKEERAMKKQTKRESLRFGIDVNQEKKNMKKQRNKREYGLGLPHK